MSISFGQFKLVEAGTVTWGDTFNDTECYPEIPGGKTSIIFTNMNVSDI